MTNHLYDALIAAHAGKSSVFLECSDRPDLTFGDFVTLAARIAHKVDPAGLCETFC